MWFLTFHAILNSIYVTSSHYKKKKKNLKFLILTFKTEILRISFKKKFHFGFLKHKTPRNKLQLLIGYANKRRSVCLVNFHLFGLNSASELLTENIKDEIKKKILYSKWKDNEFLNDFLNNRHVMTCHCVLYKRYRFFSFSSESVFFPWIIFSKQTDRN